jgi:tetratricopeptide (TPR) repeat protein
VSKNFQILLILIGVAIFAITASYFTPRVLSLYYQMRGGWRLDQVIRKVADQPQLDLLCEPLPQEKEIAKDFLILSVRDLNTAVLQNPENSQAYLQLGKAQCLLGLPEKAKFSFQKYTELKPKNPLGYLELGFVNESLGDQSSANAAWTTAKIGSDVFLEVGKQNRKEKRYEEAAEWDKRAIGLTPQDGDGWYEIGLLYNEMGRPDMAIEAFQQSLDSPKLSPGMSSIYYQIGKSYLSINNDADVLKARTAFEKAIEIDEFIQEWEKADSHYRLGIIAKLEGEDIKKSIEEFKTAVNVFPNHVNAHIALGEAYYYSNMGLQTAEDEFRIALEIDPKNEWGYYRLGEIYRKAGIPDKAIEMYRQTLKIDPSFNLAKVQIELLSIK